MSMKILVGSLNPVKLKAVEEAFQKHFDDIEISEIDVPSGVSNQPIGDETFIGAENRAIALKNINDAKNLKAEFFVGIEGGIVKVYNR